jgi:hypothetical protein
MRLLADDALATRSHSELALKGGFDPCKSACESKTNLRTQVEWSNRSA